MRDINRAIERIERAMERALDGPRQEKPRATKAKPTIHVWRAPAGDNSLYVESKAQSVFQEKPRVSKLSVTARSIKVSVPLDPAAVGALPIPNQDRVELAVSCDGQLYATNISAKSLRKAKTVIGANGAETTFVMLQGKLKGNEIIECGLVAQAKVVK